MSNQQVIQDELRSFGSNLPVVNRPSFSVPEGYFENLAAAILTKVKLQSDSVQHELQALSPLLAGASKVTPYSVPFSYFNDNVNTLPVGVEEDSAMLAAIGKDLPYTVPDNYFASFSESVLGQVTKPKTKVVPMFGRNWLRVAAAAVVAGAALIGGLQYFGATHQSAAVVAGAALIGGLQYFGAKGTDGNSLVGRQSTDTSSAFIAQAKAPVIQEIKKLSTEDLEQFVQNVPAATASVTPHKDEPKKEATEMLKDVSVNEMENFLSTVSQNDDELSATDQP